MDISSTLEPNSDQLDAVELLGGSRIFTIESVSRGSEEQPVNIHLADFPRPWRPGKSMRRVLASCWGVDASAWVGRRVELYCDPNVRFGSEAVGGTRIARLSHIDGQKRIPLLVSRGKSATFTVEPMADSPTAGLDDDPVTLPSVGKQLTALSRQERVDLYGFCGVTTKLEPKEAHALFTAKADEFGVPFNDPPDIKAILDRARILRMEAVTAGDGVEEFDRFARTGEDLDAGDQSTLDAELKA